jgi:hypothetical protein
MKRLAMMFLACCTLCSLAAHDAQAKSRRKAATTYASANGMQPQQGLENILNLWRDGRFEELYQHTTPSGKTTKEAFIGKLSSASRRPASSWEKMQEVNVVMNGDDAATVHAKLGFEGGVNGTEFSTRSYRLVQEEGVWKMSQSDILALAGTAKRKHHRALKK